MSHTAVAEAANNVLIGIKDVPVGFELRRVGIQYYDTYELAQGTYRVMDPDHTYYWDADPYAASDPGPNSSGASGIACNSVKQVDGTQLFQVDWTSHGYVTVFDCYTGRYIGDRNGHSTMLDGAISELYDNPNNWFDDRLRFYWNVVPVYSGTARSANHFYLCNVLTGNCLYMTSTGVKNSKTQRTGWYFVKQTVSDITANGGADQGYNGNTGVYMDSFDHSNTIKLPIKIYDYVNDGMLFEYAQYTGTSKTETINDVLYQLGNNKAFTFQSGSNGGAWTGLSSGYSSGGNAPTGTDAWNTYKTFILGKVWVKYTNSGNGWYTQNGVGQFDSRNDYSWEANGLGSFRGHTATLNKDAASVYYIYGYDTQTPQGIGANKYTFSAAGKDLLEFTTSLKSGQTTLSGSSLTHSGYSYDLFGYITGHSTLGLVQPTLNPATNAPEYRDVVVEYLADLLSKTLYIGKQNSYYMNGNNVVWNGDKTAYNYVAGSAHQRYQYVGTNADGSTYINERDFASWLRARLGVNTALKNGDKSAIKIGSYQDTMNKVNGITKMADGSNYCLIGTWEECKQSIQTCCDAAYFMLNNLFVPYSYNEPQDMFDYLELISVKIDDSDGNIVDAYVFDSGFTTKGTGVNSESAVYYDTANRIIKNSAVTGKANAFYNSTDYACAHPFLPIWDSYDMTTQTGTQSTTNSPYLKDDGVSNMNAQDPDTYQNRNYNYVLVSNGEFQYSYDDELFFNFEGDDDVYLFINGQLVLDIGGAHAITGFEINLNDYVDDARAAVASGNYTARDQALALVEGGIYDFDFYYMERHGWGSNMRLVTNIRVVEKGMLVSKDGAQFDTDLDSNDMIDPDAAVEYKFSLTNSGTEDLIWPTFVDSNIGVTISYSNGLVVTGSNGVTVMDKNGGALDVTDLIVTYTNPKTGNTTRRTFATNGELTAYLTNELIIETQDKSTPPFGVLTIGGIYYKLTEQQVSDGVFHNTVQVTAYTRNGNTSTVHTNVPTSAAPVTIPQTITGDSTQGPVDGSITVPNEGNTNLARPTISIPGWGVTINPEAGLQLNTGAIATDEAGDTLDVSDLTFTYTSPSGSQITKTFTDNQELMDYLQNELVVEPGGSLTVEGIYADPVEPLDKTFTDEIFNGFTDSDRGVSVTPEGGLQVEAGSDAVDGNGGTLDVTDLVFVYTAPDGTVTELNFQTNEELKAYLQGQPTIESGGSLTVEGIHYKPQVEETVDVSFRERDDAGSKSSANNKTGDPLTDSADFTVYVPNIPSYYHWMDHELVISSDILVTDILDMAGKSNNPLSQMFIPVVQSIDTIALANEDGDPITSSEVWVDGLSLHAKYQTTGIKLVYLNVGYTYKTNGLTKQSTTTIPVRIYVYRVEDRLYVLDYGLRLELSYEELFGKDVLELEDVDTLFELTGVTNDRDNPYYGNNNVNGFRPFTGTTGLAWGWPAGTYPEYGLKLDGSVDIRPTVTGDGIFLVYTPKQFMDGYDHVYLGVRVEASNSTAADDFLTTDIRQETEMFKDITFMPANVVYYEDSFPSVGMNTGVKNDYVLENPGDNVEDFVQPSFTDEDMGVIIDSANGLQLAEGSAAMNQNGTALTVADLTFKQRKLDGTLTTRSFATNEALIAYLSGELAVEPGDTLTVSGIYFSRSSNVTDFENTVTIGYYPRSTNQILGEAESQDYTITTKALFQRDEASYNKPQSPDQTVQYGYDKVYAGSSDVTMSGGTIATVTVGKDLTQAARFTFKGTGFEMVSRTDALTSAIVEVAITDEAGITNYYPVITEFDQITTTGPAGNGGTETVYQVPVFRITDLPYGSYEVTISGIPTLTGPDAEVDFRETTLYIDGIRIYNPLGTDSVPEYGEEDGAIFTELRSMVFDSTAAVVGLTLGENGAPVLAGTFGRHYSFTENLRGWFEDNTGDLKQFAIAGPNNEIYVDGTSNVYALVLYVKETAGQGLLHVGVHDLYDDQFYGVSQGGNVPATLSYWQGTGWTDPIPVGRSGTEQYYAVDYRSCPQVDGYYQVVIQVASGMASFTNAKTVGLTFGTLAKTTENVHYQYEDGVLLQANRLDDEGNVIAEDKLEWIPVSHQVTASLFSLRPALMTAVPAAPEPPAEPEQTEPTEPEQTKPTEPEQTEPAESTEPTEKAPEPVKKGWWQRLWEAIVNFFKSLFGFGKEEQA